MTVICTLVLTNKPGGNATNWPEDTIAVYGLGKTEEESYRNAATSQIFVNEAYRVLCSLGPKKIQQLLEDIANGFENGKSEFLAVETLKMHGFHLRSFFNYF